MRGPELRVATQVAWALGAAAFDGDARLAAAPRSDSAKTRPDDGGVTRWTLPLPLTAWQYAVVRPGVEPSPPQG